MSEPRPRGQAITASLDAALLGRFERWIQRLVKFGYIDGATRGENTLVNAICDKRCGVHMRVP